MAEEFESDGSRDESGSQEVIDHNEEKSPWSEEVTGILDDVILEIGDHYTVSPSMGPQSITVDEDENEDEEPAEDNEKKKVAGKKAKSGDDDNVEDGEEGTPLIRHMRKTIDGLQRRVKELETPKEAEKEESKKEDELSEEQILAIMREHEGDPEVMLNVMKYVQKQGIKSAEKAAEATAKVHEIKTYADKYFGELLPKYGTDDFNEKLDKEIPVSTWGLEGNPLAREIQTALALAATFKEALKMRLEASSKPSKHIIEEKRQESIQRRGGLPRGDGQGLRKPTLSAVQMSKAKEIGLKTPAALNLYAKFLGKKG